MLGYYYGEVDGLQPSNQDTLESHQSDNAGQTTVLEWYVLRSINRQLSLNTLKQMTTTPGWQYESKHCK